MKKFRLFITVFFLLASFITILLFTLFDNVLFFKAADVIKNNIWPAGIALFVFLVLLTTGIVSNHAKPDESLINNGYFQLAILELFLLTAGLGYFRYYLQQPGQIVLRLQTEEPRNTINLSLKYLTPEATKIDTVRAPGVLRRQPAGKYRVETIDQDIVHFQADIVLEPAETETLVVPVVLKTKTLIVQSEPTDAEIWIDGLYASHTPHTFEILNRDTVILELKMPGYQVHLDTIILDENRDLGVITLVKLYTLWVSCLYPYTDYKIYDTDGQVVFASSGSRKLQLAQGKYRIAFEIGEGQFETRSFSLNYNFTISIP